MRKKTVSVAVTLILVLGLLGFSDIKGASTASTIKDVIYTVLDIESVSSWFEKEIELEQNEVIINRVVDGDTVNVQLPNGESESVRLLLIDTPESVHPNKPVQPFGEEASAYAKEILKEGDTVTLEIGNPERDKYDRLLGYIWIDDVNFNQLMIEEGFARIAYVYEPNTKYLDEFERAEKKAEAEGKNIWSIPGYVESEFEEY